ncbi:MAG: hypothetical protein J6L88_04045 [Clostridia bacterium]|nr:hypothetical protein [Clostridia bacterium]
MNNKRFDLTRHAPLGMNVNSQFTTYITLFVLATLYSFFYFNRFSNHLEWLYEWSRSAKVLIEGAVMPDFVELLEDALTWFWAAAGVCLLQIPFNYRHHYRETKSIYLMKRLPKKFELHRRCLTLPILGAGIMVLFSFVLLLLYFWYYMAKVPSQCMQPDQWAKIWSVLR